LREIACVCVCQRERERRRKVGSENGMLEGNEKVVEMTRRVLIAAPSMHPLPSPLYNH
jgi:hypothetical protein